MPVFVRSGGAWTECSPFSRSGGAWEDADGNLYARDADEWKLIWPDPATVGALLPVVGLAVTSGPGWQDVTIGWTNPTQPTITPTDVQVRLAELGAVWTELAYPITEWTWGALTPQTTYVAQVRLIERVNGVITNTSPTRHVEFTTTAAPVGAPAPDPGDDTITVIPIVPSVPGTPTAPGTSDGCWLEWKLQTLDSEAYSWSDSAVSGTTNGDADDISIDFADEGIAAGQVVRVCWRSACDTDSDTVADTWGDWNCGASFVAVTDWGAACGNIPDSTTVTGISSIGDTSFRFPKFCLTDDRMVMIEAVSSAEVQKGPGFFGFYTDASGEQGASVVPTQTTFPFYPSMVASASGLLTTLVQGQDWALVARFRANASFSGSDGRVVTIASYGAATVAIKLTESATGWTPSVDILTSAGITTLTGAEITFDSLTTHTIIVNWDDDGDAALVVDNATVDTEDVTSISLYETVTSAGIITSGVAGLVNMQQLGYARVLTSSEIAEFNGDLFNTMLGLGPYHMYNFDEASATFIDYGSAGLDISGATANISGVTLQQWTSPDGVSRARVSAGAIRVNTYTDTTLAMTGGVSVIAAMAGGSAGAQGYFSLSGLSSASNQWELTWDGTRLYVRYGRSDTSGAWRSWSINKTLAEINAIRLICLYLPGDATIPTLEINGVAQALTLFFGPAGTQDKGTPTHFNPVGVEVSPSATHYLGPVAFYDGDKTADFATIATVAETEGWFGTEVTNDPTLTAWYDFSDTSTISHTGGNVTAVADKALPGLHGLTLEVGTPRTGDTTQNGLNVLDFLAGENLQKASTGPGLSDQHLTMYAVFKATGGATYDSAPCVITATNQGKPLDRYDSTWYHLTTMLTPAVAWSDMGAQTTWCVFTWTVEKDGVSAGTHRYKEYKNGSLVDQAQAAVSWLMTSQNIGVGQRQDGVTQFIGSVGEIRIYNAAHDSSRVAAEAAALATKWGA